MMWRRLGLDAAIVAALVLTTAAYENQWHYMSRDLLEIEKMAVDLGQSTDFWRVQLISWSVASVVGMAAMLVRTRLPLVALVGSVAMTVYHSRSPVIPVMPLDIAPAIALFTLAASPVRRWLSYAALAATVGCAL